MVAAALGYGRDGGTAAKVATDDDAARAAASNVTSVYMLQVQQQLV